MKKAMKIVEFLYDNKSHMGYTDFRNPGCIQVFQTHHAFRDILNDCFKKENVLLDSLRCMSTKPFFLNDLKAPIRWLVPALSGDLSTAHVFGFGYTHKNRNLKKKQATQPERFYKGDGSTLFPHNEPIIIPKDAKSVGEEAELVVLFHIKKRRELEIVGYAMGNDLSDPLMRRMNAQHFAASKLRPSAIGAELCVNPLPSVFKGSVSILRNGRRIWQANYSTGTSRFLYSMETLGLEFMEMADPIPGHIYYVFLGADKHSFSQSVLLENKDTVCIDSGLFVFPLINQLNIPNKRAAMLHCNETSV